MICTICGVLGAILYNINPKHTYRLDEIETVPYTGISRDRIKLQSTVNRVQQSKCPNIYLLNVVLESNQGPSTVKTLQMKRTRYTVQCIATTSKYQLT